MTDLKQTKKLKYIKAAYYWNIIFLIYLHKLAILNWANFLMYRVVYWLSWFWLVLFVLFPNCLCSHTLIAGKKALQLILTVSNMGSRQLSQAIPQQYCWLELKIEFCLGSHLPLKDLLWTVSLSPGTYFFSRPLHPFLGWLLYLCSISAQGFVSYLAYFILF